MKNFLKAVEFPKLLDQLASHCQTPAGRDYLKVFNPTSELALIEGRLAKTQELEKHLVKQKSPSIPDSQFFIEAFERARGKGRYFFR